MRIDPTKKLQGTLTVPGDKSISHRAQILVALALGTSRLRGLSDGEDVASTRRCLQALGVSFRRDGNDWLVDGVGPRGLRAPAGPLDCGNSGSTMRMLMGVLSGQPLQVELIGDASLTRRPMRRVSDPLAAFGARLQLRDGDLPPVRIEGRPLQAASIDLAIASAQVKSALLLAGLNAEGETVLTGELDSRDHTERLFPHFGIELTADRRRITLRGGQTPRAADVDVPGDPSSAAFWLAAGAIVPGSHIRLNNVLLNPTRLGFLRALRRMGVSVRETVRFHSPEPVGDLEIRGEASLHGTRIEPSEVPSLIDELPMLAVLATYAHGVTEVRGARELRVKESDRIEAVAENLRRLGASIQTFADGFRIQGRQPLRGARLQAYDDHRIAMAFAIGALGAAGPTEIEGAGTVSISYPGFFATLRALTADPGTNAVVSDT